MIAALRAWADQYAAGGRFTPAAPQEDYGGPSLTWWPGEVNDQFPVRVFPQEAPDPSEMGGAYGEIPARPAQNTVVLFHHEQNISMGPEDFVAAIPTVLPHTRAYPRGRMTADPQRANIARPAAVAYGSLFQYASRPYGLG